MLNTNLFARVWLSIDGDREHSSMRQWCGTTCCIAGRGIQETRKDLDLFGMNWHELEHRLNREAGGCWVGLLSYVAIQHAGAVAFGIKAPEADALFHSADWIYFWPDCEHGYDADAPAMLTAIPKFIRHYYPEQIAEFWREVDRLLEKVLTPAEVRQKALAILETVESVTKLKKHDWDCVAPEGGFYRWKCRKCPATRPYPDPNPPDPEEECPETYKPVDAPAVAECVEA